MDFLTWIVITAVFVAVTAVAAVAGFYLDYRRRVHSRLVDAVGSSTSSSARVSNIANSMAGRVEESVDAFASAEKKSKLRSELIKAGFFSPKAATYYFAAQASLTLLLPLLGYIVIKLFFPLITGVQETLYLILLSFIGYKGPEAYVNRRQTQLQNEYRVVFPDFLDLLVVSIDAGLSINAAIDRVTTEFAGQCKPLADNLSILLSEIRSGRAFPDALENLTERLGIEEARSFNTLIKQSIELGSDIATALRVYSDEMRTKRLLRAELIANSLPVKMLLPLGLFIFPVLLAVVLAPAMLSLSKIFSQLSGGAR